MKVRLSLIPIFIVAILLLGLYGCGRKDNPSVDAGKLRVITTLFPLYDFARNVGGDAVRVTLLLPPGLEPHSFEPKPGDVLKVNEADVFIYTGKEMEPWVENLLKSIDSKKLLVVDASKGITLLGRTGPAHEHEGHGHGEEAGRGHSEGRLDPHIWLDFTRAQKMVENIRDGFISKDPQRKDLYLKNAADYNAKLAALDGQFKTGLSNCLHRFLVHGGHFAFNYLAKRYDLEYVSAYEGSPDAEPSPRKITELKKLVKEKGVKYIYYEELITPRVAEVVSRETGCELLFLHGAHNISKEDMEKGATFLSLMERNLENLRKGLECR